MGLKQSPLGNDHFDGGQNVNQGQGKANEKSLSQVFQDIQNQLNQAVQVYKFTYDFALQGGAQGDIDLMDQDQVAANATPTAASKPIPDNSLVVFAYADIITTLGSGGSATIVWEINGTGDLLGSVAFDNGAVAAQMELLPQTTPNILKLTAARGCVMTIGTADLDAGKFDLYIHTVQGS